MSSARFRRELAACSALVRHAYYSRANKGRNILPWLLLAAALLIPPLAFAMSGQLARSIGFGAGAPLAFLALYWWVILVWSIAEQNRHEARLVPRIGQRSAVVLVSFWTVIVIGLTLLATLAGVEPLLAAGASA